MNIDNFRKKHMAIAEWIDAWRIFPRALVVAYGYMVWDTIQWYESLHEPTNQHAMLVTTVVGAAALVFGMYTNSGRAWGAFTYWEKDKADKAAVEEVKGKDKPSPPSA